LEKLVSCWKEIYFCHAFEKSTILNYQQIILSVDTLSYKTVSAKKEEVVRQWYVIDAENLVVGRLCSKVAHILRGKHRPDFTPHVDCGDYVIVVNADKVRFTGKKWSDKIYLRYTGYPGGQRQRTAATMLSKKPTDIVELGVKGMLPKTKLGRAMVKKLFIYTGADHQHQAQKPTTLNLD